MGLRVLVFALSALMLAGCGASAGGEAARPPAPAPPASAQPIPGGGLSIDEALATDAEGPLAVKGALVATGADVRLCSTLAESYPPQCGGSSLSVRGLDLGSIDGLERASGVAWAERVSLLGDVRDGVLVVDPTVR